MNEENINNINKQTILGQLHLTVLVTSRVNYISENISADLE